LVKWTEEVRERRGTVVPDFDPAESGVEARVLILLEAPGPMTNAEGARPGSGLISVDNDDLTAENCWRARSEVGLDTGALHWNIVPWYLGPASVHPSASVLAQGGRELRSLLPLLPELKVVILAGRHAQNGWNRHSASHVGGAYAVIETWHPSPLSLNRPGRREEFTSALARARALTN
jgi:hypothetical protein